MASNRTRKTTSAEPSISGTAEISLPPALSCFDSMESDANDRFMEAVRLRDRLEYARNPDKRNRLATEARRLLLHTEDRLTEARELVKEFAEKLDVPVRECDKGAGGGGPILQAVADLSMVRSIADSFASAISVLRQAIYRHDYRDILNRSQMDRRLVAIFDECEKLVP